jgi:hypothetical protein
MAQPITNLTADWIPSTGVNLQWTAATDATNASVYEIYVLEDVLSYSPSWNLVSTSSPYVVSSASPGNAASTLLQVVAPATSYTFPAASISALQGPGSTVAPSSLAFLIIHIDYSGASSTGISVSAFQAPQNRPYGVPHFQNSVSIDNFGQFDVNPQDSYEDVSSCVAVFLGTLPGQRPVIPDYGTPDLTFSDLDVLDITNNLGIYEPRADARITVQVDDNDNATLSVLVQGIQGGT